MAALKYLITKYGKINGVWISIGSESINEDTPEPYNITLPENKSYQDTEWKIVVQRHNDPAGCNSSGETYLTVPSGETCFCTCDNVSYFYHVNMGTFPNDFGEGVTAKTYEIMTGYTQGCGTLSASTDSDLFVNRQIDIGYDPVTGKYSFSATVNANESASMRTGRAYIYFKSYFEGGEYLDCSKQIYFQQKEGDIETCELVASAESNITYIYGGLYDNCNYQPHGGMPKKVCTLPYNPLYGVLYLGVKYFSATTWGQQSSNLEFKYVVSDDRGWSVSGDSCSLSHNIGNGVYIGYNMSTSDTRVITATILPYVQGGCDFNRGILISGAPCSHLEETFTIHQHPWGGCGCHQLADYITIVLDCDYYTQYSYIGYYDYKELTKDDYWYECWTVDDIDRIGETIESGGSQVSWINISSVHESHYGYPYENGALWYRIYELKNYSESAWTATAIIHWKGKGDNVGNTCTTEVHFTKETDPSCLPSDCDCTLYTSRVDKVLTLGSDIDSTASFGINTSSYYPCSYDITSIELLDESVGDWCNVVINQDGKSGFVSATSTNNSCETRISYFDMRLHTSGTVEYCDYSLQVKQNGKCNPSGCTDMFWSSGNTSDCYDTYKTTGDTFNYIGDSRTVYLCGKCASSCLDGGITYKHTPEWISIVEDGSRRYLSVNSSAIGETALTDTIQVNVGGTYCPELDYTVTYDYQCNCDLNAVHLQITETGYTRDFPNTGGTLTVCKLDNYTTITSQTPCIVISATSTSQWDGTSGVVDTIIIEGNGEVKVTCRANTSGVVIPFTIDFNEYDDTKYCGDSYHSKVDCQISG